MDDFNEEEAFRFKRQAPETRFFSMEAMILGAAYDIVEHMQQMRKSTSREEIAHMCDTIDRDVEHLREHLRDVKAETKQIRGAEPLSKQTDVQPHEPDEG